MDAFIGKLIILQALFPVKVKKLSTMVTLLIVNVGINYLMLH